MFSESRSHVTLYSIIFVQSQAVTWSAVSPNILEYSHDQFVFVHLSVRKIYIYETLWRKVLLYHSCNGGDVYISSFKHPSSSAFWEFCRVFAFDFKNFNAGMLDFLFPDFIFVPCLQIRKKMSLHIYDLLSFFLIWCVCFYRIPCLNSISVPGDSFWEQVWMMTKETCSCDNLLGRNNHCILLGTL